MGVAFDRVPLAPLDPIFGLTAAFQRDPREDKVDLGIGIYRGEGEHPPVLNSVKRAEAEILAHERSKGYLPIEGYRAFIESVGACLFGEEFWERERARIAAVQAVGGTGALKLGGTFLKEEWDHPIFVSTPTWPNHRGIFHGCGLEVGFYPYFDVRTSRFEGEQFLTFLRRLEPRSIIVLQGACHNPTGWDLSEEEWQKLVALCAARECIPFLDIVYPGFGKGIEEDLYCVRAFAERGLDFLVAFSASKIFSLYGERVGALFVVASHPQSAENISSRIKMAIRANYSNPPMHGAKIVSSILRDEAERLEWTNELDEMRQKMDEVREAFALRLERVSREQDFTHIKVGRGMFTCLRLTHAEIERLRDEHAIYVTQGGRINLSCLNPSNIDRVVEALAEIGGVS